MRLPILFILITVIIDAMGIGLIMPVMPELIQEVQGGGLGTAALWGGLLASGFAVMQFLCGPMIGALSDSVGRRPVLLISLAAMAVDYLVMAVAGSIWLLLAGRIFGGITASTYATAGAYMADISKPEEKAANFGLIGAAFGVGFVLGPIVGGLLGAYGTRAPFYAAAALAAMNTIFGAVVMRETVTDRIRRAFTWRRANPLGAFRYLVGLPEIRVLMLGFFLFSVAFHVYPAVWAFFAEERFGWGPGMIGLSLTLYGLAAALVQGLLIRPILRAVGDWRAVLYGLAFDMVVFAILAFVTNGAAALVLTPLTALGGVAMPALQGIMSRATPDDAQGELQGLMASATALATIVSPLAMTSVFAAFTAPDTPIYLPGAPFLVSLVLVVAALAIFRKATPLSAQEK
ncbi:TCR/Tet family MFS transporter [Chachezhania antarctica]|uniref:TCR/Tet family MFS transporter n=1 Tax=Chachezhania antarctica TaxID=2340860 RepID=UPI000EB24F37|nr:TCR/Tet family MFS transporter [Chachezhania antarctica]